VSFNVTLEASLGPKSLTVMVNVTLLPGAAKAGAVFVTPTSARFPPGIDVPDADVSFSGLGSGLSLEIDVVLIKVVPAAPAETFWVTMNSAVAPLEKLALVHVTVPPEAPTEGVEQMNVGPLFCTTETNVPPAGRVSVNVVLGAASGPLLPMSIV
jgi:hypothetical protein